MVFMIALRPGAVLVMTKTAIVFVVLLAVSVVVIVMAL